MDATTRIGYWGYVLKDAFLRCFQMGIALGFAIFVTLAIAIYQNLHHVSITTDGWWVFLEPYALEFCGWFALQVSESCWRFHRAATNQTAIRFLEILLQQGQVAHSDFVNLVDAKSYWSLRVSQWETMVKQAILENWGIGEQKKFTALDDCTYTKEPGPEQHRDMLRCYNSNLAKLISELKKTSS